MTKTTEELKREMYSKLAAFKRYAVTLDTLEQSIEAYLEGLRQDMQCASIEQDDLSIRLANMTTERDDLRNKLQAFEFANRSAAELLSEALREPSGLRKTESCALAQRSQGNASCDMPEALLRCPAHFIQTNCKEGRHFMVNSNGPDGGLHCLACGHHREIPQ